jgi:hypothetical protein
MQNRDWLCFSEDMLIDPIPSEDLLCPICFGIMREPVLDPCNHRYNRECLRHWLNESDVCPISKLDLDIDDVKPLPELASVCPDVRTRCLYFDKCEWTGTLGMLQSHLDQECAHEFVLCELPDCKGVERGLLPEHIGECQGRVLRCRDCLEVMSQFKVEKHLGKCPTKLTNCYFGCWTLIRQDDISHWLNCIKYKTDCFFKRVGCIEELELGNMRSHCFELSSGSSHINQILNQAILTSSRAFETFEYLFSKSEEMLTDSERVKSQFLSRTKQLSQTVPQSDSSDNFESDCEMVWLLDDYEKIKSDTLELIQDFEYVFDLKALIKYPNKHYRSLVLAFREDLFHAYILLRGLEATEAKWKANEILKSNPELIPHEQTNSQETTGPIPSNDEAYTPYDYENPKFSIKNSFGCIQVIDGTEVRRVAQKKESMLLLKDPIVPFTIYTFDWRYIAENSIIGMGLCKIEQVKEAGYSIPEVNNHGCYMLFSNNEFLINGQPDRKSTDFTFEGFEEQKRIAYYYDPDDRKLKFISRTKGFNPSIDLSSEDDLSDFYPCISTSKDANIEIYPRDGIGFESPAQFIVSREHKASEFFLGKWSIAACFRESTIGVLEWRLMHNRPYKFQIVNKQSDSMGFILTNHSLRNHFLDWRYCFKSRTACFLANGDTTGSWPIDNRQDACQKIEFETGDVVQFTYNEVAKYIILSNLTKGTSTRFRLIRTLRDRLTLTASLKEEGECIRIIP